MEQGKWSKKEERIKPSVVSKKRIVIEFDMYNINSYRKAIKEMEDWIEVLDGGPPNRMLEVIKLVP